MLRRECYNLSRDYDSNGVLLPTAVMTFKPATTIQDMDKTVSMDAEKSWPNTKAYIATLKARYLK
jgi:hypothetical protein